MAFAQVRSRITSLLATPLDRLTDGLDNQSKLLDIRTEKIIAGVANQSDLLNRKLEAITQGIANQSKLLDERFKQLVLSVDNLARTQFRDGYQVKPHEVASAGFGPTRSLGAANRLENVTNDLREYAGVFDGITPWSGVVPKGYLVDFLGILTPADFRTMFGVDPQKVGGHQLSTRLPIIEDGEGWFEAVNWVVAAKAAQERFTMVTLGACYGAQAVGSCRALQVLNPMPYRLVAVEPDPANCAWTRRYFRDNGIDPKRQWIIQAAIGESNAPVFFPVGSPGTGAQNCFSTNERAAREIYVEELVKRGAADALRNLLLNNTTGIAKPLVEGHDFSAEIKVLSAVTLADVLGPFEFVDYLESDIQQSEILVFPPYMDLLKDKVRRIHIGTHGKDVHAELHRLFERDGWQIIFSYEPNSSFATELGPFVTNDGVLTVRNPNF